MHFPEQDVAHSNKKEPCLTSSSVTEIIPAQPAKIPVLDCGLLSAGVGPASLHTIPFVVIPSLVDPKTPDQLAMQLLMQPTPFNSDQRRINDSEQGRVEQSRQIAIQQLQMSENDFPSVELMKMENVTKVSWPNDQQTNAPVSDQIIGQTVEAKLNTADTMRFMKTGKEFSNETSTKKESNRNMEQKNLPASLLPLLSPKFRRILPKPQSFHPDTLPIVKILQKSRPNVSTNSVPKPDILIIPKTHRTFSNGSGRVVYTRYPGNKRPILRISINKEYDMNKRRRSDEADENIALRGITTIADDSVKNGNLSSPEMTIKNPSTNRAVTFKLDRKSGEIVMTTRRLDESTRDEAAIGSTTSEQKVDNTKPSPANLRRLYKKGQQECIALRKKLRILRQRHKEEQDEIQMLQEHLTELDEKIENTGSEETSESRFANRKEIPKIGIKMPSPAIDNFEEQAK